MKDVPFLLKIFRRYKFAVQDDKDSITNYFYSTGTNIIFSLLVLFLKHELNLNRESVLSDVRVLFSNFAYENKEKVFELFTDQEQINFFSDYREGDLFHIFVKWFQHLQSDDEFFYCRKCDSIMIPTLLISDSYFCSNKNCDNSGIEKYHNHCWNCFSVINSDYNLQCKTCGWYICNNPRCKKCRKDNQCEMQIPINRKILLWEEVNSTNSYLDQIYSQSISHIKKNKNTIYKVTDIQRGKKILETANEVEVYITAYLKHHIVKLNDAFDSVDFYNIKENLEIFDWGCGMGVGCISFVEKMRKLNLDHLIKKVFLIEPSFEAISRGNKILMEIFSSQGYKPEVKTINKKFHDIVEVEGLTERTGAKQIHIFSNILDVDFDLTLLIKIFTKITSKRALFVCISPNYKKAYIRINTFCDFFRNNEGFKIIAENDKAIKTIIYDLYKKRNVEKLVQRYHKIFETNL